MTRDIQSFGAEEYYRLEELSVLARGN